MREQLEAIASNWADALNAFCTSALTPRAIGCLSPDFSSFPSNWESVRAIGRRFS